MAGSSQTIYPDYSFWMPGGWIRSSQPYDCVECRVREARQGTFMFTCTRSAAPRSGTPRRAKRAAWRAKRATRWRARTAREARHAVAGPHGARSAPRPNHSAKHLICEGFQLFR